MMAQSGQTSNSQDQRLLAIETRLSEIGEAVTAIGGQLNLLHQENQRLVSAIQRLKLGRDRPRAGDGASADS